MQKEFDLVKVLSDTAKVKEMDSIRAIGAKEMLDEVVTFINSENLKIYKDDGVKEAEKTKSKE